MRLPDCVYHGRQWSLTPSCRESIQRRVPASGTMPSTSPENTCGSVQDIKAADDQVFRVAHLGI